MLIELTRLQNDFIKIGLFFFFIFLEKYNMKDLTLSIFEKTFLFKSILLIIVSDYDIYCPFFKVASIS